MTADLSMLV